MKAGKIMTKKSKWVLKQSNPENSKKISEALGIHPLCANALINRGIETLDDAKQFLNPDFNSLLDPFLLKDMDKGVNKVKLAIENNEKIVVYGDYDVDGITAVSIIYLYLKSKNAKVEYYIPSRSDEGYGLNKEAVLSFKNDNIKLIITADCGITAVEDISYANSLGMSVVITDHHKCKENIPDAYAVINPKRADCSYPFKDLSGVGVAFKFIEALAGVGRAGELLDEYGDLLCLGTIADIVTLTEENRVFVALGLKLLANPHNLGLKALIEETGLSGKLLTSSHVGFIIAPRINAVGRLGNALDAVKLFTTDNSKEATELAKMLCTENIRRQTIEKEILIEACEKIDSDPRFNDDKVIVLSSEKWHHGVIGIVASRITEKYGKPCLLIAIEGDEAKGSCRGVIGFNMFAALSYCEDLLLKFGGHELAAGLTIQTGNIKRLSEKINQFTKEIYQNKIFIEEITYEGKITDKDINLEFTEELEKIQPCGMGNPVPQFLIEKVKIEKISYFGEDKHIRLRFTKRSFSVLVIGFGMGSNDNIRMLQDGDLVNAIVTPYTNEYKGKKYPALKLKDIKLV
jgi:single-stranded-DNA-specific exonuclease